MAAHMTKWLTAPETVLGLLAMPALSTLTVDNWQNFLMLVEEQRLDEAHEQIDHYLTACPNHPHLWIQRGNLLWKQHRLAEAELAYRHAAQLMPESAAACWCLVLLYQCMERTEEAARWYRRAISVSLNQTSPAPASF